MGFLAPTTHEQWRIHLSGACRTPDVALSGFLTLSVPCSPPRLPTLFHAGNAHGVHPSELSPLEESCHLSAAVAFLTLTASLSRRLTRTCHAKRATPAVRFQRVRDVSTWRHPVRLRSLRIGSCHRGAPPGRRTCSLEPAGDGPTGSLSEAPGVATSRSRRRHLGLHMPGGVEPSARRVGPKLHPPVGTARTPCGRQDNGQSWRPVPKHRTLRCLGLSVV
jgi:hypothetical protein